LSSCGFRGWLPVAYSLHGGAIVVDGANGVTAECAVVAYTEPEMNAGESGPRAGSLGEMVTWWIEA
jgi:hypothetical protein